MLTLLRIYQAVQETDRQIAALTKILLDHRLAQDKQANDSTKKLIRTEKKFARALTARIRIEQL